METFALSAVSAVIIQTEEETMPREELHLWAKDHFRAVCHKAKVLPMRSQSPIVVLGLSSDGLFVAAADSPAKPHEVIAVLDRVHVPFVLIQESDGKGTWYQREPGGKYVALRKPRKSPKPMCCDIKARLARAIVGAIHDDQQRLLREQMLEGFLSNLDRQFSRDDLYLYELLQNATDDFATRVSFEVDREPNALVVQHNGRPFHVADVLGLANVGLSTKGGRTIGFMGLGFKTVYERFTKVTCSDDVWHFRFEQPKNSVDSSWKMLPKWDDGALEPDNGFSCRFTLTDPHGETDCVSQDMRDFCEQVPPLLARRVLLKKPKQDWQLKWGQRELRISLVDPDADEAIQRLCVTEDGRDRHWLFVSHGFEPTEKALEAFYEFRKLDPNRDGNDALPGKQQLTLFCELDEDLNPIRTPGVLFAVLPTDIQLQQMGCHLQGNWLPSADRQRIQHPKDNAWNLCVIEQLPNVIVEFLCWIAKKVPSLHAAYKLLPPLTCDDGSEEYCVSPISGVAPINAEAVRRAVQDKPIVPVLDSRIKLSWPPEITGSEPKQTRVELIRHLYEHVGRTGSTVALKFRSASDVLRLPRLFTDLFTAEFLDLWLGKPVFLANCVGQEGCRFWDSLEVLDVPDADGLDEFSDRLKEMLFAIDDGVLRAWAVIRLLAAVRINETSEGFTEVPAFIPTVTGELRRPKNTVRLKDEFFEVEQGIRELLLPCVKSESDLIDLSFQRQLSLPVSDETAKEMEEHRKYAKALLGTAGRELSLSDILSKFFAGIGSSPLEVETVQLVVTVTRWARKAKRRELVSHVVCKTGEGFQLLPCQTAFLGSAYGCLDVEMVLGNAASFVVEAYLETSEPHPDERRLWHDFFASESNPVHSVRSQLDFEWATLDRYSSYQGPELKKKYAIDPPQTRIGSLSIDLAHSLGKIWNHEYVIASPKFRPEWSQALQDIHKQADLSRAEAFARVLAQRNAGSVSVEKGLRLFWIPRGDGYVADSPIPGWAACWIEPLRELRWVPSEGGGITLPGEVLLNDDVSRPDAPVADLRKEDRERLKSLADALKFGERVPRSSVTARLTAVAGSPKASPADLVSVWREVVEHFETLTGQEQVQTQELEELRDVAARCTVFPASKTLLDDSTRVNQSRVTLGSRGTSLGGWLVELRAEGHPLRDLAESISKLLNLPERPTAEHALDLWRHCSHKQLPARDAMEAAYSTLIDELSKDSLPTLKSKVISDVVSGALRFCCVRKGQQSEWLAVNGETRRPVYNDAPEKESLLRNAERWAIETLLPKPDHPDANVLVNLCGLTRLSDQRFVINTEIVAAKVIDVDVSQRWRTLGQFLLAVLENHRSSETLLERGQGIAKLNFRRCERIQRAFVVDGQIVSTEKKRAVIKLEDNAVYVVGKPNRYFDDLEEAVLQYMGASEYLTSLRVRLLFSNLEDADEFDEVLAELCREADIDIGQLELPLDDELSVENQAPESASASQSSGTVVGRDLSGELPKGGQKPVAAKPQGTPAAGSSANARSNEQGKSPHDGDVDSTPPNVGRSKNRGDGSTPGGNTTGGHRPSGKADSGPNSFSRPAARDWFRVKVSPESAEDGEHSAERDRELRDDKLARAAVVRFEEAKGRKATPMDDLQPGYDVKSDDASRGVTRLIEVKGVTDKWEDTATVKVSNRQFEDGRNNDNSSIEYWLYVVDSLGTQRPLVRAFRSVMKIPAHFYFQAQDWLNSVDEQGEVDMAELPIAADSVPEFEDHASL